MHIPDGLMAPEIWILGWLIALPVIALAVYKVGKTVDEKTVPFMAMLGAGIFVAQMVNFPVGGGTSGHLIGAALAAALLGVYGSVVVLTVILVIQCFVFGDGGVTALGLNLLNMAVIAPFAAAGIFRIFRGRYEKVGIPVGAWISVFLAALACAVQLGFSYSLSGGAYGIQMNLALISMAGWHIVVGVGEAIITTGVV
ncbi:MAG: energy-coupling factor ABC transporter permease, partial [Methanomassiliicoccales archaeon]